MVCPGGHRTLDGMFHPRRSRISNSSPTLNTKMKDAYDATNETKSCFFPCTNRHKALVTLIGPSHPISSYGFCGQSKFDHLSNHVEKSCLQAQTRFFRRQNHVSIHQKFLPFTRAQVQQEFQPHTKGFSISWEF